MKNLGKLESTTDGGTGQMQDATKEDRPTTRESYASAVSAGNTRVHAHRTTPADLIAAAGMNPNRMGMALMRLSSEWNSGAVPKPADAPDVKALALDIAKHRVEEEIRDIITRAFVDGKEGLSSEKKRSMREGVTITKPDIEQAHHEAKLMAARSVDWNLEENKLRFQRLKTLPTVRAGLTYWVLEKGWDDGEHLVAAVLRHFLSPNCPACNGSGLQMIPGTLGREAKKRCKKCERNEVRGKRNVPHGGRGKRLLDHLQTCVATAARDLREGAYRMHRDGLSEQEREDARSEERAARARRVAAEAAVDAKAGPHAVAAVAQRSMGLRSIIDRLVKRIIEHKDKHGDEPPSELVVTGQEYDELWAHPSVHTYTRIDPTRPGAFKFMGVPLVVNRI